jgi:hypothetical protein
MYHWNHWPFHLQQLSTARILHWSYRHRTQAMYPTAALAYIGTIGHSIYNNPALLASFTGRTGIEPKPCTIGTIGHSIHNNPPQLASCTGCTSIEPKPCTQQQLSPTSAPSDIPSSTTQHCSHPVLIVPASNPYYLPNSSSRLHRHHQTFHPQKLTRACILYFC